MKTLNLRRHSIKDGKVKDSIGPKGLALAQQEGAKDQDTNVLCHGPLLRTAQTAGAYGSAMGRRKAHWLEPVLGLGDDGLFAEMATAEFKAAVGRGLGNFAALLEAQGLEKCKAWAQTCLDAVESTFNQLREGETATGFFHSPTVELAAWAQLGYPDPRDENELFDPESLKFGDLEGITFVADRDTLSLGPAIRVEK